MTAKEELSNLSSTLEGGVFYPTGYIVAGIQSAEDAGMLRADLLKAGYEPNDCILVSPQAMEEAAESDVHERSPIAFLGSSVQVRQQHIALAREGCSFLLVYAPTEPEKARVMRVLARVPVRYLVHYHRFTIEDLIDRLSSATSDSKTARTSKDESKSPS
jgi:hypothetical protein